MTRFYIIRHGESEANLRNIIAGVTDFPLTERGITQARLTAERLSKVKFSAIYSSPLLRALETARPHAELHALPITPETDLMEINAGEWEGKSFAEVYSRYPEQYLNWSENFSDACPNGGESVRALYDRVVGAIARLAEVHDGETVLLVTHATPIRAIMCKGSGYSQSRIGEIAWVSNASFTEIEAENSEIKIIRGGEDTHLKGISTIFTDKVKVIGEANV